MAAARRASPEPVVIRVTVQRDYVFQPSPDGRTPEELIHEFFTDFQYDRPHAGRDAALVYGGSKVLSAEHIPIEEIGYKVGGTKG